jgi:hypothetical protein
MWRRPQAYAHVFETRFEMREDKDKDGVFSIASPQY